MGKLSEKIVARSRAVQPRRVEVPELGEADKPLVVYMHPLTLKERSDVMALVSKDDMSSIVRAIRLSARDDNDKPVFDKEDEMYMASSRDTAWIMRLANIVNVDLATGVDVLGEKSRLDELTT